MHQILLLNCSYFPIQIITAKKAIRLLFKKKAEAINDKMETVKFNEIDFKNFPKVIRLLDYSGIPLTAKISKKNILKRDKYRCVYCGETFPPRELTVDHIEPKSRGGKFSWNNLITACIHCNNKKGSRTPDEAGMKMLFFPRTPSKGEIIKEIINSNKDAYELWNNFIPS